MPSLFAALSVLASTLPLALSIGCPSFDINGAAYIHDPSGDYSLGDDLATASLTPVNATGRPSFTGNNTQCFTNQFTNGLYVLGADDTTNAYIFNFADKTWSTQATSGGPASNDYVAILDHDTVVLFAYANGSMSSLSFDQSAAKATSAAVEWAVGASNDQPGFTVESYNQPVLGAANNHIQFLNTPGSSAGQAYIFVIHFAYFQPEVQSFGNFPVSPGQTVTIFSNSSSVPNTFAYIPDGATDTYVIDAKSNTTATFAAPPTSDALSRYAASTTSLLQLTSNGTAAYLDMSTSPGSWTMLNITLPGSSSTNSSTTSSNSTSTAAAAGGTTTASNGAVGSVPKQSGAVAAPASSTGAASSTVIKASLLGVQLVVLLFAGINCLL